MAKNDEKAALKRLAVVNEDLCRPKECGLECKRACPVNRIGKQCIVVDTISHISETLCIGCSACQKKCPFKAITIVNLPNGLTKDTSHRYSENGFKLHRLPIPKLGSVLGLVGTNGIGKSTALSVLSGKVKPNLGNFDKELEWTEILKNYRGSELHGYFTKLLENRIVTSHKIQYIDKVPKLLQKKFGNPDLTVFMVLDKMDPTGKKEYYIEKMSLTNVLERKPSELSGGELQRFCIALACMQNADTYIFDEPSSYLDVRQRLTAAREIRKKIRSDNYIIVVEHDLAILDLMSDYGCVLYGMSGAYGVITAPQSIKNAINIFLDGFIPTENMRFRDNGLKFSIQEIDRTTKGTVCQFAYPTMTKTYKGFELTVESGHFSSSEITVFLGENGMGKTTLVGMIAGLIENDQKIPFSGLTVSLKPQKILPKYKGSVRDLFMAKIRGSFFDQAFATEVLRPLSIEYLLDQQVTSLSGGELQRVAIAICLGTDADVYLLDEPSAFLDSDQRIAVAKLIKKFIYNKKKSAFIVEHDLVVGTYLADKVIVFSGVPGLKSVASPPVELVSGMNRFLSSLDVTFRRDPENFRPRINKPDSTKDREQKETGNYFFV
ncbi:ATP-binding cassette, sub-family E, member 1 [Pancytospora epiphaga]|nr:ATP-binding cassette, sub-family E, member 1 [Pancytospora epiphaga]